MEGVLRQSDRNVRFAPFVVYCATGHCTYNMNNSIACENVCADDVHSIIEVYILEEPKAPFVHVNAFSLEGGEGSVTLQLFKKDYIVVDHMVFEDVCKGWDVVKQRLDTSFPKLVKSIVCRRKESKGTVALESISQSSSVDSGQESVEDTSFTSSGDNVLCHERRNKNLVNGVNDAISSFDIRNDDLSIVDLNGVTFDGGVQFLGENGANVPFIPDVLGFVDFGSHVVEQNTAEMTLPILRDELLKETVRQVTKGSICGRKCGVAAENVGTIEERVEISQLESSGKSGEVPVSFGSIIDSLALSFNRRGTGQEGHHGDQELVHYLLSVYREMDCENSEVIYYRSYQVR